MQKKISGIVVESRGGSNGGVTPSVSRAQSALNRRKSSIKFKFSNNYYANNFYNDLNSLNKFKDNFFPNKDFEFEHRYQKVLL